MGNKETAECEFAQALVKELQELHTRNYLREIGIVPKQILFAAKHTIEELLRQVAVLETEAALREPAPQPQAEPVACTWPDCVTDGRCDLWCTSAKQAGVPNPSSAPQPQASAEDLALVGRYVTAHKSLKTDLHDAWQRIRADYERMGVGRE